MRTPFVALAFSGLCTITACAVPSAEEATTSAASELSVADFDAAAAQLSKLPYLPWSYTPDGCYARALYYSMHLATLGIPTKHLYVFRRSGAPRLYGIWGWHVAPVATKDGQDQLFVFDPALSPNRVITAQQWVSIQGYRDPRARNYPELTVAPGTSYLPSEETAPFDTTTIPASQVSAPPEEVFGEPSFEAMESFRVSNVTLACDVMHVYLDREEGNTATELAAKHAGLAEASVNLVRGLAEKDKLTGTTAMLNATCTAPPPASRTECRDSPTVKPSRPFCCLQSDDWCWSETADGGRGDCLAAGAIEGNRQCVAASWNGAGAHWSTRRN